MTELNERVRSYWEKEPCGTNEVMVGDAPTQSPEWFARVEQYRYTAEPFIHAVAQFTRHRGKRLLEVGVGAGSDHLQWARAGADCHGVDLTDAAIETTRAHLKLHGLASKLQRVDAETLPFPDAHFDVVYSWGVIHHSEQPQRIIAEIHRVLRRGGEFVGMLYGRRSLVALKLWLQHGLFKLEPFRPLPDIIWNHVESVGTKAYTHAELRELFGAFREVETKAYLTPYDTRRLPRWIAPLLPDAVGFFISVKATK